jgi:hypothetical protein
MFSKLKGSQLAGSWLIAVSAENGPTLITDGDSARTAAWFKRKMIKTPMKTAALPLIPLSII